MEWLFSSGPFSQSWPARAMFLALPNPSLLALPFAWPRVRSPSSKSGNLPLQKYSCQTLPLASTQTEPPAPNPTRFWRSPYPISYVAYHNPQNKQVDKPQNAPAQATSQLKRRKSNMSRKCFTWNRSWDLMSWSPPGRPGSLTTVLQCCTIRWN